MLGDCPASICGVFLELFFLGFGALVLRADSRVYRDPLLFFHFCLLGREDLYGGKGYSVHSVQTSQRLVALLKWYTLVSRGNHKVVGFGWFWMVLVYPTLTTFDDL